jgi:hypothetical protein
MAEQYIQRSELEKWIKDYCSHLHGDMAFDLMKWLNAYFPTTPTEYLLTSPGDDFGPRQYVSYNDYNEIMQHYQEMRDDGYSAKQLQLYEAHALSTEE